MTTKKDGERGNDEEISQESGTKAQKTPTQEINEILKASSFGLFHIRLLCASFFAFVSSILVSNTTPYILPNAECDLNMSLLQKGILNGTPFVGMLLSSIAAGFLTDTFGRKLFLVAGYGGIALFTMFSAASQTYEMLVIGKFFEGFLFAVAFSPSITFTSEYCHPGIRDRVMLLQSSFKSVGTILTAAISWGVLTQEWKVSLFNGFFVLHTWNFYLFIASLWPLTAAILYSFLPESPKYLVTQHRYEEARNTLVKIYTQNSRKTAESFPFPDLWKHNVSQPDDKTPEVEKKTSYVKMLANGVENCKPIFKRPLGPKLALLCTMNFLVTVLYNVVRLWFPQLSTIVEHYSQIPDANGDLCEMLDAYTADLNMRTSNVTLGSETCIPTKSGAETYINSIILGCVCVLPFIVSGILVNKVGKKYLQITASAITIGCTFGLRWASSKTVVVALFATDMAIGQIMMSLLVAVAIDVFPTNVRTLAISVLMMSGRTGTLVGNVTFPILLNMACVVPFFTIGSLMICVTLMGTLLPNKKQ